jgi:alpha-tubulin suppressor-like RCC1 family protein
VSAKAVAAGLSHSCTLTVAGRVKCWGSNGHDELGDGTAGSRPRAGDVSGLGGGVTAIAAGVRHSCGLTGGGVKCWGYNRYGQLGDGTTGRRRVPVDVFGLGGGVTAIAVGWDYSCALTSAGGVKCWGHNGSGRLGDGTTLDRWTPVDVSGLSSGVTAIAAGGGHSCALTKSGGVKCWGGNGGGRLGDGTTLDRWTPVDVAGLGAGVTAITAGLAHSCALTSSGGVKCWGANVAGALGDGTTTNRSTPVGVRGV